MSFSYVMSRGITTSPSIEGFGVTNDKRNSSFGPGRRIGFTIHFNTHGVGYFNGNIVKECQGFIVYDGMYAHHYADKDNPWELMWITLSGPCVHEILQQYKPNHETNIFDYSSLVTAREVAKKNPFIQRSKCRFAEAS